MNYHQAYQLVFEYLERFYNTVKIHSHCEYLSPNEYESRHVLEETKLLFTASKKTKKISRNMKKYHIKTDFINYIAVFIDILIISTHFSHN